MRKVFVAGILGIFALGMVSCGSGHSCDAYRSVDYTKYKADQNAKIEMIQKLSESK